MKVNRKDLRKLSDEEIWKLFKSGNNLAFEYIYQEYFDKLFNYGCQFTRDRTLVEDALQELFLDLKRRSKYLSETDNILPYLYTAFRRKVIRFRDRSNKFKEFDAEHSFKIESSIEAEIIEDEMQEEYYQKLNLALEKLSERHREMIYLFYYENFSYQEIKEIQGFEDVKSARNLLYKAINALKAVIKYLPLLIFFLKNIPKEGLINLIHKI
jgi:RNA polymerase sigma-70 factor (ECF subfamily)